MKGSKTIASKAKYKQASQEENSFANGIDESSPSLLSAGSVQDSIKNHSWECAIMLIFLGNAAGRYYYAGSSLFWHSGFIPLYTFETIITMLFIGTIVNEQRLPEGIPFHTDPEYQLFSYAMINYVLSLLVALQIESHFNWEHGFCHGHKHRINCGSLKLYLEFSATIIYILAAMSLIYRQNTQINAEKDEQNQEAIIDELERMRDAPHLKHEQEKPWFLNLIFFALMCLTGLYALKVPERERSIVHELAKWQWAMGYVIGLLCSQLLILATLSQKTRTHFNRSSSHRYFLVLFLIYSIANVAIGAARFWYNHVDLPKHSHDVNPSHDNETWVYFTIASQVALLVSFWKGYKKPSEVVASELLLA